MTPEKQFLRQTIPVEIQRAKPLIVKISCSGNGVNAVGIRCPPDVWAALTNGSTSITVNLKSSSKPNTEIGGADPTSDATGFLGYVPNVHYLFYITGPHHAEASVEIAFLNAPTGVTQAEIVVGRTPIDTKP
jgi:hypothetical protein